MQTKAFNGTKYEDFGKSVLFGSVPFATVWLFSKRLLRSGAWNNLYVSNRRFCRETILKFRLLLMNESYILFPYGWNCVHHDKCMHNILHT